MKSTFRVLFYVKRDKLKQDGSLPVMCRITVDGQASRFNTKVNVNPESWDPKSNTVTGRSKEAKDANVILKEISAGIHNVYHELLIHDNVVSADKVKNTFLGVEAKHRSLLEVIRIYNEDIAKLVGISKSKLTYNRYELVRERVSKFIKEYYNVSDIHLKDLNYEFIHNFYIYLKITYNMGDNTIGKFIQRFRSVITMAMNNGWLHIDPFIKFKIKYTKTDRGYLTQEEIDIMMKKEFASKRLEQVRDIFILCCFTGLSYIDIRNLNQSNIRTSFDGKLWIMSKRQKTGVSFNIPLLTIAQQIIEKYAGKQPNGKIVPVTSNQKMNDYLKEIATVCGINKVLTFHMSRHTFATLALTKGVSIESVSSMLGHTNIKTTQIYARIINEKVSNDMASFENKIGEGPFGKSFKIDKIFNSLSELQKFSLIESSLKYSNNKERQAQLSLIRESIFSNDKEVVNQVSSLWKSFSPDEKTYTIRKYVKKDLNTKMDYERLFGKLTRKQKLSLLEYSIENANNAGYENQLMIINWKIFSGNSDEVDTLILALWNSFSKDEKARNIRKYFDHIEYTNQLHDKDLKNERRRLPLQNMYDKKII